MVPEFQLNPFSPATCENRFLSVGLRLELLVAFQVGTPLADVVLLGNSFQVPCLMKFLVHLKRRTKEECQLFMTSFEYIKFCEVYRERDEMKLVTTGPGAARPDGVIFAMLEVGQVEIS